MIRIQTFIGMPLWYAKSVLEKNNITYTITRTSSRNRFFVCDQQRPYVIRASQCDDGVLLLINDSMVMSDSVASAFKHMEGNV